MTARKTLLVGLLGCALVFSCCLAGVFLIPGPFAALELPDGGVDLETPAPPSREALMDLAADAGLEFATGSADLWWGGALDFPEDDDLGPSLEQEAADREAAAALKRLEALTGTSLNSGLGPRQQVELKVGVAATIVAEVNNRGGPTDQATLELSGSALASGLVTVREVWAYGNFAPVSQQPPDAGQPLVLEFGVPIGPFMTNPRAVEAPYEMFKHLRGARVVIFYVTLLGKGPGKGELLLRVRDKTSTGKGRLLRHEISVAP